MNLYIILHFTLMGLAAVFIGTAVFIVRKKTSPEWLGRHRNFASLSIVIALAAFLVMVYFKQTMSYPHFKSGHAISGLVTLILVMSTATMGNLVAGGKAGLRDIKIIFGRITAILVYVTAAFGILRLIQLITSQS